jgi:sarcosine oxidase subunit alpha
MERGTEATALVPFEWDGTQYEGPTGVPVGLVLWQLGVRSLGGRRGGISGGRALYCGIGHCFECRVTVDGRRDVRSCLTPLRAGMVLERQGPPSPLEER